MIPTIQRFINSLPDKRIGFALTKLFDLILPNASDTAITANSAGTQTAATKMNPNCAYHNIATCGGSGYGVRLPPAIVGAVHFVKNSGANSAQVFGNGTDTVDSVATATGVALGAGSGQYYVCLVAGNYLRGNATLTGVATSSTTAELDTLHLVTAGTVSASKAVVVDSNKSADVSQVTTAATVGGTGVPGAATTNTRITKAVTAFADTVAKAVFTVTVPNAAHAAVVEVNALGVLGAGGAIGAGEGSRNVKYQVVLARTAGVATVATASAAIGGAEAHVAGAANVTSVVATVSAMTGAVGATQTFTINFAITKSAGTSDNHTGVFSAEILNQNATGVTIA